MIGFGLIAIVAIALVLAVMALMRGPRTFERGLKRAIEQLAMLVPRFLCALIAAGFVAKLLPSAVIGRFLGEEAGLWAVPAAAAVGLIVPAGPVVAFSVAVIFARAGASVPALVAFLTAWSLFAVHRIFMYEVPLVGLTFVRLRVASVIALPILAGLIATAAGLVVTFSPPGHP